MIYDSLENLGAYRGISPAMDAAIDFLMSCDMENLMVGRVPIDGDMVYVLVSAPARKLEGIPWEAHRAYIDVHVSISYGETIIYLPVSQVEDWGDYTFDVCLSNSMQPGIPLPMDKNRFAVFFPWDAHRPNLGSGTGRKLVVKVAMEAQ